MKIKSYVLVTIYFLMASCQKEVIKIGKDVSETFYVQNEGASMRVLVEGNSASKTMLIFVHGGPGSSSYFYNSDYISQNIEDKYAVVYWDQRSAGASQGNKNGDQLNLKTMTNDLKKVILALKSRYGQETNIFILGHSWGGMLTTSFLTTENNQDIVKGWIMCSGSHNYPLNNELTKEGLLFFAKQQIALKKRVDEWTEILDYCNTLVFPLTLKQANQLNTFAANTESYFDEVKPFPLIETIKAKALKQNYAITSTFLNSKYSQSANINNELANYELSTKLNLIKIPVLILYGKYDLICPPKLGDEVFDKISSVHKSKEILPNTSHVGMYQDQEIFCNKVNLFINQFN